MKSLPILVICALAAATLPASARSVPTKSAHDIDATGSIRPAPGNRYGYDTDSDNDRRPELRPDQQGGGQQTGGPARNLIPGDNLHFVPR